MATTPKYAIPYPVSTDKVIDGENAMQAIAERVEAILSGAAGARYWTNTRATGSFSAGTWTGLLAPPLTGLPVGGVAGVSAVLTLYSNTATMGQLRVANGSGYTVVPAVPNPQGNILAGGLTAIALCCVVTATAADPTIIVEGHVAAGTPQVVTGSHLIAWRIS
jgi:hypothetical protein